MSYYSAVISIDDQIIETGEYTNLEEAVAAISDKYLVKPESMSTLNADCRIDIWGKITRISIHPTCSKLHRLKDGFEHVKTIQLASEEQIATTILKNPSLGEETSLKPDPNYVHVRPASTSTVQ